MNKLTMRLVALAAIGLAGQVQAQSAAETAVEAAKQYRGYRDHHRLGREGLQSLDPLNFSGPKWKELTGIDVKVIELPIAEMFTKILAGAPRRYRCL